MIIGIAGKFGAGKDAAADVLAARFGFTRLYMATALRNECADALSRATAPTGAPEDIVGIITSSGLPASAVWAKPTPAPIRRLLQFWGSEHRRRQHPDYWTCRMLEQIDGVESPIVIPDIRFPNEAAMVRALGGKVWLVNRQSRPGYDDPALHSHISEQFCDTYCGWDAVLENNGTLAELERQVVGLMRGVNTTPHWQVMSEECVQTSDSPRHG